MPSIILICCKDTKNLRKEKTLIEYITTDAIKIESTFTNSLYMGKVED